MTRLIIETPSSPAWEPGVRVEVKCESEGGYQLVEGVIMDSGGPPMTRDREGEYLDASFAAFSGGASDPPSIADPSQPRPPQPEPLTPEEEADLRETRRKGLFLPSEVRTDLIDRLLATLDAARAALGGAITPDLERDSQGREICNLSYLCPHHKGRNNVDEGT